MYLQFPIDSVQGLILTAFSGFFTHQLGNFLFFFTDQVGDVFFGTYQPDKVFFFGG